ncbi:Ribosome biogenesis ATPase rix7 [Hypoxylon texense]
MASKTTYIPRYLLPQYGALWRTATRSTAFTRPLNAELGQVLVRYASKTAASKPTATPKTPKTAATKVVAPKSASTKASSKTAAAKAAKASAPTKPLTKASPIKPAATRATAAKAAVTKSPTPPATSAPPPAASEPVPVTPAPETVVKAEPTPTAKPVDPSKPLVLEKPEKFNPPSHGARLPRSTPKHYGGPMSDAELQAQNVKTYPGLPPPDNTWTHWFIHSRSIHLFITLGTLTSLAIYTFIANFKAKSPFADMIPPISEFPRHPFQYVGVLVDVMRLHEEHESALTAEKRRMRVDDVAKRNEYRKAHGMEPAQGFWASGTSEPQPEPQLQTTEPEPAPVVESAEPQEAQAAVAADLTPDGKRKKFLGIF